MGGRWCEHCRETHAPAFLANGLCTRPLTTAGGEDLDSAFGEGAGGGEVGNVLEVHVESPQVPGHSVLGRHAKLRAVSIPLGPRGVGRVSEVQRADNLAALPSAIGRLINPPNRVAAGVIDTPPGASDADRWKLPGRGARAQEKESFSSSATSRETDL